MNWEALLSISTAVTGVIILFTVVLGRRELEEVRRATQLEGMTPVFAELDGPLQQKARRFVFNDLHTRMQDPDYRREVEMVGAIDEEAHPELIVLRFFERIGMYVEQGLIDGEIIYNVASGRIVSSWHRLHDVVEIHRQIMGPPLWKNFERLYDSTTRWQQLHGYTAEKWSSHVEALRKSAAVAPSREKAVNGASPDGS